MIDLGVTKNFAEFLPHVRDNLIKMQERLIKVVEKKEINPLIEFFINQSSEPTNTNESPQRDHHLETLRQMSESFY